jgi:hypothetical protein
MQKFKRTRAVVQSSVVALAVGALVFGLATVIFPKHLPRYDLTAGSGTGFTITSSISSSEITQTPAHLVPGTRYYLWYTAHNPLKVSITVKSMSIAAVSAPAGCPSSNLDYSATSFSGSLVIPASGSNAVPEPISLASNSPIPCENVSFGLTYAGTASYTEVYGTLSSVTSSSNPSSLNQEVTYKDTVTASVSAGQDPVPNSPTGTVTFKDGSTAICTSVPVASIGTTTAAATCQQTYTGISGSPHSITAVYSNSDGNFSGSTSSPLSQIVQSSLDATTTALNVSPNPSTLGGSVSLSATVTKTSGAGTPSGIVTFYSGTPTGTHTLLGSGTQNSNAKATLSSTSLAMGTDSLYAVYGGSASFSPSTSPMISEVVNPDTTATAINSSPNPSGHGNPVTITASVTKSTTSGSPTGTVNFYSGTPSGTYNLMGTASLAGGKATITTSGLPTGTDSLYAVYGGDASFAKSTSPVNNQVVIGPPANCTGSYTNTLIGVPGSSFINGTNGNDFIYAFASSYWANGFGGNDCLDAGDGNNVLTDGDGSDAVSAGNGDNVVLVGDGNDKIVLGNGTNGISAGNGNDSVIIGNGSHNGVLVGNGIDSVTIGSGSYDSVDLGSGTSTVTLQGASNADINGGNGNETIYLGAGTYNKYSGALHRTNICHLPTPPPSWHGTAAAFYHDTITNCSVVTP